MAAGGNAPQFASLYVGDLHPDVTEAILYEIFNSVGTVGSIRVCRDSVSRRSLGYGYVNFHNVTDAERALETLNYSSIKGRACRIMWSQRDPSLRKSGVGNIYVKNLDRNIDNKALYDTFSLFGNILSCKVACDANGKSRGYGFVHYETEAAAKQAIERVNGMQIGEKTVEVRKVVKRGERDSPKDTFTNLYIKGIPEGVDEEKLKELFAPHGPITSSCIMEDKQQRKFAFVNYETTEAAKKAIEEMNGTDLRTDEQKSAQPEDSKEEDFLLYVGRAQTKAERAKELRAAQAPGPAAQVGKQSGGVNLYVKNLDEETNDDSLKELFSTFGTIPSAVAMKDERGRCKGFGFVCFESPSEATQAVTEMHLKVVKGKPLYVGLAEKREARQERLKQRYSPTGGMGKGGKEGKGKGKMGGMGQGMNMGNPQGAFGPQGGAAPAMGAMGAPGAMGGAMGAMAGMGGQMMGMGGMMGKGMMCGMPGAQMMGGKGGPMMGAKGPMGMMGMMNPQMMAGLAGKGGPGMMPPQMMGMMGGKGQMAMGMPGMGAMGMVRPMMPQMQGAGLPQQQAAQQQAAMQAAAAAAGFPRPQASQQPGMPGMPGMPQPGAMPGQPLTAAALAAAPAGVQKQMLGEKLFPAVSRHQPELAGKITGMMLEMDNSELLMLLESDVQLKGKVEEAMRVLEGGRAA